MENLTTSLPHSTGNGHGLLEHVVRFHHFLDSTVKLATLTGELVLVLNEESRRFPGLNIGTTFGLCWCKSTRNRVDLFQGACSPGSAWCASFQFSHEISRAHGC